MLPYGLREEDLTLVGSGAQGKVYRLDATSCIKIYHRTQLLAEELKVLRKAVHEPQFPKVYRWGEDYVIREFFPGVTLKEYLQHHPLTEDISRQLVELFRAFERLGFNRLDTRMAHIIVTPDGKLKAIDPTNAMLKSGAYPEKLLGQLDKMKCLGTFFQHLRHLDPNYYERWSKAMQKR